MKLFGAFLLAVLVSANAYAVQTELRINSNYLGASSPYVETRYSASSDLNRAFLVVTLSDRAGRKDEVQDESYRVKIDGLSLESSTGNIVFQDGNTKHICASPKTFLGSTSYKATGNCQINVSNETKKIDDGFELKSQRFLNVNLQGV